MEKRMLLVPKIWQEESYLLLEISFLLAEGHRWQKEGSLGLEKGCFEKETGGEVVKRGRTTWRKRKKDKESLVVKARVRTFAPQYG